MCVSTMIRILGRTIKLGKKFWFSRPLQLTFSWWPNHLGSCSTMSALLSKIKLIDSQQVIPRAVEIFYITISKTTLGRLKKIISPCCLTSWGVIVYLQFWITWRKLAFLCRWNYQAENISIFSVITTMSNSNMRSILVTQNTNLFIRFRNTFKCKCFQDKCTWLKIYLTIRPKGLTTTSKLSYNGLLLSPVTGGSLFKSSSSPVVGRLLSAITGNKMESILMR